MIFKRVWLLSICSIWLCSCTGGADAPLTWDSMFSTATDASQHGQFGKASKYFQMAIDRATSDSASDPRIITVACAYGDMQAYRGRLADAELLYKNAIEVQERQPSFSKSDIVPLQEKLAKVLQQESKNKEAKQLLAQLKAHSGEGKASVKQSRTETLSWPALSEADTTSPSNAGQTSSTSPAASQQSSVSQAPQTVGNLTLLRGSVYTPEEERLMKLRNGRDDQGALPTQQQLQQIMQQQDQQQSGKQVIYSQY